MHTFEVTNETKMIDHCATFLAIEGNKMAILSIFEKKKKKKKAYQSADTVCTDCFFFYSNILFQQQLRTKTLRK